MPSIDFKQIKQDTDIVDIVQRNVKLTKNAGDFEGLCPFHDEKTPSFMVSPTKQIFKCFGCGAGGDVFDYTMLYHKMTHAEAGEYLAGGPLLGGAAPQKLAPRAPAVKWTQISPAPKPTDADLRHYQDGDPSRVWIYKNADGSIYGLVCRFDYADGSKNVRPAIYCTDGKIRKWKYQAFDKPRQLYNLEKVIFAKVAIIVEGEKCADYLQSFFPPDEDGNYSHAFTCWQGGTNAIKFASLAPLAGKGLILWPDNDEVGRKCMAYIAQEIAPAAPWVKYVHVPENMPKGWDGADMDWTEKKLREWIRQHIHDHIFKIGDEVDEVVETPPVAPEMKFPEVDREPMPPAEPEPPRINDKSDNPYFRALGFETDDNGPVFVFFNKRLNCIQRAGAGGLTKNFFQMLGTDTIWMDILGEEYKIENQIQWVINICGSKRMFSETNIRGRGAWFDEGRAILHVGNHLYVDGEKCGLGDLETKYIYSVGFEMDYEDVQPLQAHKGKGVLDLLGRLSWERPVNAVLLAGWCVVAPICGALDWRPHIWVTGPAGTGKSWVFQNVVSTIVGNIALKAQGETSEAGVRQALGSDARPVIFDEAEGEDRKAQERIQSVLQLMRGASTSDGGDTIKGSASGTAKSFKTRSCFAFASIGVPISQQSDRTRITMLTLTKSTMQADEWSRFEREFLELVDSDFIAALRSRTVKMIPTIKRNAKIFSKAAAVHLGSQRAGDQAGVLLAGAYALLEDGEVTYENAKKIIERHDWSEEQGLDKTRDEMRLLSILMDTIVRLDSGAERTVAELVTIIANQKSDDLLSEQLHRADFISKEAAERRLNQYGFRVDGDMLAVSNSTGQIKKILNDTPWSKEHHRILSRIDGAVHYDSKRFAGTPTRAVGIPLKYIL